MKLHTFWNQFPDMESQLKGVSNSFKEVLESCPSLFRKDLEPLLLTPGKMLRPAFVLLGASVGSPNKKTVYKVAAAVELLHIASLIHDDVLDRAKTRRGQPTLNSTKGNKRAILAGDFLLMKALELASIANCNEIVEALCKSIEHLCLSEIDQDSGAGNFFIDRETYYNRISGKTAELFGLSCQVGALLGGASTLLAQDFYMIGHNFGMDFQIQDDNLDFIGNSKVMGKAPGSDIRAGIPTLPLILGLEKKDKILQLLCRRGFSYIFSSQIKLRVIKLGLVEKSKKIGEEFFEKAIQKLSENKFNDAELMKSIILSLRKRVS